MRYANRTEAGRELAGRLAAYAGRDDVVVLGLPRGGVPVAAEVAAKLGATLDVWCVRKIGAPWQPEYAIGALASGGVRLLDDWALSRLRVSPEVLEEITTRESDELARREQAYRGDRPRPELTGRIVILVDDGLATGLSMRAAVIAVGREQPARVVVAVPVGPRDSAATLGADEVVCPYQPSPFLAVGRYYADFDAPTDDDVRRLLAG